MRWFAARRARTDERDLVDRMLAGHEVAFDEFMAAYLPRIYRFALSRIGDPDAAEDIAQSTLAIACRKLHTWRGEATLFTWLVTICRREIAQQAARSGHEAAQNLPDDHPDVRATLETLIADSATEPDRALEAADLGRLVQATLDYLPGRYGDVLEWKYLHGCSVAEIADRLGLSVKAAESQLTRARAAFREAYTHYPGIAKGPQS
jgi:RNA polymerase sigma-70 factor (ECF subfamily)